MDKIKLGISSCLIGQKVRYNGEHKYDSYINNVLTAYFDFVPICPEVGVGLGTPREPIRLVKQAGAIQAVGTKNSELNPTKALSSYLGKVKKPLASVSGYILKKDSPSCGMERVKVYGAKGAPSRHGVGIFAEQLLQQYPSLPVEEEGRLHDPVLRENFIERVFVYARWQQLIRHKRSAKQLVDFHTRHKLQVMAHSQAAYRKLGRLVADAGKQDIQPLYDKYILQLMDSLKVKATRKNHANVLYHLLGFLKKYLLPEDKAELVDTIEMYRQSYVPLIVPITLFKHYFRKHPSDYIAGQHYLDPHPFDLSLRCNV